jgi:hypothetical protein
VPTALSSSAGHFAPGILKSSHYRSVDDLLAELDAEPADDIRIDDNVQVYLITCLAAQHFSQPGFLRIGEFDCRPDGGYHPRTTFGCQPLIFGKSRAD